MPTSAPTPKYPSTSGPLTQTAARQASVSRPGARSRHTKGPAASHTTRRAAQTSVTGERRSALAMASSARVGTTSSPPTAA